MTYEDPRTGRERNLGQDDVGTSTGSWIAGLIILGAIAFGAWYYYDHTRNVADLNHPTTNTATNPAAQPDNSSATGASTGTSGTTSPSTQPSQDATGAKTAPNAPKP
ncbi:hypothetical protein [Hyphomicrobium sp. 2TAF46]|uniref:hypothetical protein n=1 Tax=Hyphomicrobium sp. 2TAF46 TaxID=3233019 RepID=UPI003F8F1033